MPDTASVSDKALAVFAFAAYHQLGSGQPVTKVIRGDGHGHKADEEAVQELQDRKLAVVEGNDIRFSEEGLAMLGRSLDALRSAGAGG